MALFLIPNPRLLLAQPTNPPSMFRNSSASPFKHFPQPQSSTTTSPPTLSQLPLFVSLFPTSHTSKDNTVSEKKHPSVSVASMYPSYPSTNRKDARDGAQKRNSLRQLVSFPNVAYSGSPTFPPSSGSACMFFTSYGRGWKNGRKNSRLAGLVSCVLEAPFPSNLYRVSHATPCISSGAKRENVPSSMHGIRLNRLSRSPQSQWYTSPQGQSTICKVGVSIYITLAPHLFDHIDTTGSISMRNPRTPIVPCTRYANVQLMFATVTTMSRLIPESVYRADVKMYFNKSPSRQIGDRPESKDTQNFCSVKPRWESPRTGLEFSSVGCIFVAHLPRQ